MRLRFLAKLYAGYVALILIAAGIIGVLASSRVEQAALQDVDRQLEATVHLLNEIATEDPAIRRNLQRRLETLGQVLNTRLTIIDVGGVVLAESDLDPLQMDNHSDREEVVGALRDGRGKVTRFSDTTEQPMRYIAIPWTRDGKQLGVVRASMPLTDVQDRRAEVRSAVFLGVAVAAVIALLLGYLLARRFTRPLREMADQAQSIASTGAYGQRVPVRSKDEVGRLAVAFNTMSENLLQSISTIRADRNKLTAILSSMAEGVVAVDQEERVVHMNQIAGQILGVDPREALERPIWEISRVREVSEALHKALELEDEEESVIRLPGLQDRYLEIHTSPLRVGAGMPADAVAGAVVVLADVTRLRRLEAVRRDFVGNVSHELKTPVTAIRGMVETLVDDPDAPPEILHRFHLRMQAQSERLVTLVQDLLALSRLEAEEQPLESEPIELGDVLRICLDDHRPSAEVRRIELLCDDLDSAVVVYAEEEGIRQAVGNLLSNAIKYSPDEGQVEIRIKRTSQWTIVEVRDEGPGIEPRHHERLFERFYRIDAARSRLLGGTGLGLAIVKHTMLAFDGDVGVESLPGEGSTFSLRFPVLQI